MRKFREPASRKQISLLPASIEDYVNKEDGVRYIDEVIDRLDLSEIEKAYSEKGRPGYSPRVLVKIIAYGKLRGIRSGRDLSTATKENLKFIFLANNETPDFRTINLFRKRFAKGLAGILQQTVKIGISEGVITLEHVCIDGTKIGASAGRNTFKTKQKLEEDLKRYFEKSIEEDIKAEEEEDEKLGDDDGEFVIPKELQDKEYRRERIEKAIEQFEKKEKGRTVSKVSTTDPESRYMRSKGTNPAYNAQAAIDADSKMIVGGYVTNHCTDECELAPVLESVTEITETSPISVSADKGYSKKEDYLKLEEKNIIGYVAQRIDTRNEHFPITNFKYDQNRDIYICPNNKELTYILTKKSAKIYQCSCCEACSYRNQCLKNPNKASQRRTIRISLAETIVTEMRERLASDEGKQRLKTRGATIEPFFGIVKSARKLRQFSVRTLERVNYDWLFELATHNIAKLACFNMLKTA